MATSKSTTKAAETLFVEWDQTRLLVIQGTSKGGVTNLDHAFAVERDPNLRPSELGEVLKQELSDRGIKAAAAVILFPRELVTFSRVTVPNIAVEELPDLVKMQAATKLTVPVESVCLDFTPLPTVDGMQTREALLVTAPQEKVNGAKLALSVCGIDVTSVQVSSFAIAEEASACSLVDGSADAGELDVVISLASDQIEMLYLAGPLLVFSHSGASWTSEDKIEQAVRSEVSRAQMSATEATGGNRIATVTLIGTPEVTSAVPDDISKRLNGATVRRVDPTSLFSGNLPQGVSPADLIGLAGAMAQGTKGKYEVVDLINPRKPIEKPDYTRLKRIAAIGLTVLSIAALWKWRADTVAQKEKAIQVAKAEERRLKNRYKDAKDLLSLHKQLQQWEDRDLNWLDEMSRIQGLMEGTDRAIVKTFDFNLRKGDYLASINAQGYAKSRPDVEDIRQVMSNDGYEINAGEIPESLSDPDYTFELDIEGNIPVGRDAETDEANDESKSQT